MKNKFLINGYGRSGLGDVWFTGYVRYELSDHTYVQSEECELYFGDYFKCMQWVEEMGDNVIFPDSMKGFNCNE